MPLPTPLPAIGLSPLERTVIDLSLKDPPWSLYRQSGITVWLFGRRYDAQPLANPKLEALRRYAILHGRMPTSRDEADERQRLCDAGYGPAEAAEIDRLVRRTPFPKSRPTGAFMQYRTALLAPIGAALTLFLLLCSGTARAQTEPPIDAPVEVPQEGAPGGPPDGPSGGNHFAIGIGGAYMPAHHGSDKYRFQPLPAVDIKWNRFFVNFQDGIGAHLIDSESISVGAGVVMADNYRAKDVARGMGKLPFGAGARGFVKYRLAGFEAVLGGTKIFAGSTKGFVADASISYPIMVSQKFMLNPSIGTTWADEKHLNRYFGVSGRQSLASGLPRYRLKSGIMDAKAEMAAQYRLTDSIGIGLAGGVTTLFGDAKDSPIVKKKTRPYGIFFISYGF